MLYIHMYNIYSLLVINYRVSCCIWILSVGRTRIFGLTHEAFIEGQGPWPRLILPVQVELETGPLVLECFAPSRRRWNFLAVFSVNLRNILWWTPWCCIYIFVVIMKISNAKLLKKEDNKQFTGRKLFF